MIKRLYNSIKWSHARQLVKEKWEKEAIEQAARQEIIDDLTQSNLNVLYLNSTIKVLDSAIKCAKGDSPSETKAKRSKMKSRLDWYKKKLEEELGYVEHFKAQLT